MKVKLFIALAAVGFFLGVSVVDVTAQSKAQVRKPRVQNGANLNRPHGVLADQYQFAARGADSTHFCSTDE